MPLNDDEAISLKYYQEMAFLLFLPFFLLLYGLLLVASGGSSLSVS
jgi:hypothetical protein